MAVTLEDIVVGFADGLRQADNSRPVWISRSGREYQPGLGPHEEVHAIKLILAQMKAMHPGRFVGGEPVRYPTSKQTCDIGLGSPLEWAIEVKMARAYGDNGKPDDTWIKDLLSPYPEDRSALTDAHKLRDSAFSCHRAVLVYGFDYASKPLEAIFVALETLLRAQLSVGSRVHASFANLVHPVHQRGTVAAWEVL